MISNNFRPDLSYFYDCKTLNLHFLSYRDQPNEKTLIFRPPVVRNETPANQKLVIGLDQRVFLKCIIMVETDLGRKEQIWRFEIFRTINISKLNRFSLFFQRFHDNVNTL